MKGYLAIALILALVGPMGSAATGNVSPAERVQEIFSKFAETGSMGFDVELQIFPDQEMELPTHLKSMSVRRSGDKLLKVVGPLTVLVTPSATIIVDERRKTVSFSTKAHREQELLQFRSGESQFEQIANGGSVSYVGLGPEGESYLIDKPSSLIQRAEIIADPATLRLKKLVYTYSNDLVSGGGQAILRYRWLDEGDINDGIFSEEHFIARRGGQIEASGRASGYRLIRLDEDAEVAN